MRTPEPQIKLDVPAHPRFKGFEAFALREIEPELAEREGDRGRVVGRARSIAIVTALIVLALVALAVSEAIDLTILIWLAVPAAFFGFFAALGPLMKFNSSFGDFLVRMTCQHLGLRHTGTARYLAFDRFLEARLVPSYDRPSFEDGVECADPGLRFTFAEAVLTDSGDDWAGSDTEGNRHWRGLLMAVTAPRPFAGTTLVAPKRTVSAGEIKKRLGEPIELSLGGLENEFVICTTDPEEASAVLTERLMKRLVQLAGRLGRHRPGLGLAGSSVLLAIEGFENRFQAGSVFKPLELADQINPILAELALVLEIAETLHDAAQRAGAARR